MRDISFIHHALHAFYILYNQWKPMIDGLVCEIERAFLMALLYSDLLMLWADNLLLL